MREVERQKKMKMDALKDFLSKPEDGKIEVERREEEKPEEVVPEESELCRICGAASSKRKQW